MVHSAEFPYDQRCNELSAERRNQRPLRGKTSGNTHRNTHREGIIILTTLPFPSLGKKSMLAVHWSALQCCRPANMCKTGLKMLPSCQHVQDRAQMLPTWQHVQDRAHSAMTEQQHESVIDQAQIMTSVHIFRSVTLSEIIVYVEIFWS